MNLRDRLERIEARPDAVDKWVAEVNDVASKTLLPPAKHTPGIWAPTFRASPDCSCRTRVEWCDTARFVRKSSHVAMKASAWRKSFALNNRAPKLSWSGHGTSVTPAGDYVYQHAAIHGQ
jgi:hypothetical protein